METKETLEAVEKVGETITREIVMSLSVEARQAFVQGMNNVICLLCCEERDKSYICHCESDD